MIGRGLVAERGAAEPIGLAASLATGKKVAPDVTGLLAMDHREAIALFDCYREVSETPDRPMALRRLTMALAIHMQVEEELVYPAAAKATGDGAMVREAEQEHADAKNLIGQLTEVRSVPAAELRVVEELRALIEAHVEEEESVFFPRMREAGMDLYTLGRAVAARRLSLFLEQTGLATREETMDLQTPTDAGSPATFADEAALDTVAPEEALKLFTTGLRNIHATKRQGKAMLERQLDRLENYPRLKTRLAQNLSETNAQLTRIEAILGDLGDSPSGLKDAAMSLIGNMGAAMNAPAGDEVLKNSFSNAGLVQFQIAAYEALITLGEAAGQTEALRPLQMCLNEERSLAAWLSENLRGTVISHLQLRSSGMEASH